MNILIPDDFHRIVRNLRCTQCFSSEHSITILGDIAQEPMLDGYLQQAECLVLIRERTRIDANLLARMPRLRLISQTGPIGKHIDLMACTQANVAVMQSQGSPYAPAELTWALILSANRRLHEAVHLFKQGQWQVPVGREVHGKTLGILGFGKLGKIIATYGKAFGMSVIVGGSDRAKNEAVALGYIAAQDQKELFSCSDVLSVHLRLNEDTRESIGLNDLLCMKSDSVFVNTSRAELLAPSALIEAIGRGRPGYAAIDVYESEPIYDAQYPLLCLPNVLCTPHLGYVAQNSYEMYFGGAFQNIALFDGQHFDGVVNPSVLNT